MASELKTASSSSSRHRQAADHLVRSPHPDNDSAVRVVTILEAMALSNSSRGTVYAAAARGDLRLLKRGRRTLIRLDDLKSWIDGWPPYVPHRVGVRKVTK